MERLPELLRDAVTDPPPTSIDIDNLIAGEVRGQRRRRWAAAAGTVAGVAVLAIGIGTLPQAIGGTGTSVRAGAQPSASPTSGVPETPGGVLDPTEPPAHATARLTSVLLPALHRRTPAGSVFVKIPGGLSGQRPALAVYASQGGYKAIGDIRDTAGTSTLFLDFYPAALGQDHARDCAWPPPGDYSAGGLPPKPASCTVDTVAGATVVSQVYHEAHGVIRYSVYVIRPDGTGIGLSESNYGEASRPGGHNPPAPVAQRTKPVLPPAQLAQVAMQPGLTLYPEGYPGQPVAQQPGSGLPQPPGAGASAGAPGLPPPAK